jgi:hypothetical protein
MSDEPKKRRWLVWIGWTAFLFVLIPYPLSVGPALRYAMFSENQLDNLDVVSTAYAPIWWLRKHSETARAVIDRYNSFWVGPLDAP